MAFIKINRAESYELVEKDDEKISSIHDKKTLLGKIKGIVDSKKDS